MYAVTLILNLCHCLFNAFLFIQILDFPANRGLSNIREERDSLLLIIWETSASWEILDGRVLRLWKTEKGKRIMNLHMNFCLWEYKTIDPYEGLGENNFHIDLLNFNYQTINWRNNAISSHKFFMWKGGHYIFFLLRFLFSAPSIRNGNRTVWSPVQSNHMSD